MNDLYNVSASPHIRDKVTTSTIMRDVLIALMPAALFGVYNFGVNSLLIILTTVVTCLLTEYTYQKLMKKKLTTGDYSAMVTGLLLALNLPSTVPLWIPVIGGVFAILVVKQLYGGIGQNFMNPALAARCFLLISFAGKMTTYELDGVSSATPLSLLKSDGVTASISKLILGNIQGSIGETSVIAILIGAIYLVIRKVISLRIPLIYIGSFAVFIIIFGERGMNVDFVLTHVLGGGLLLGAFFMATDYVTCPITAKGQVVFAILLGALTGIFRIFSGSSEGVSYAIIFANLLVPLIEKITPPVAFGREAVKRES